MSGVYDELLLDRSLHPKYNCAIKKHTVEKKLVNASCGDDITMQLLVEDGVIKAGGFTGKACAISSVSADLMIEAVIGKTVDEALAMRESFEKMLLSDVHEGEETGLSVDEAKKLGVAKAMAQVSRMPARVNCAKLAWKIFE